MNRSKLLQKKLGWKVWKLFADRNIEGFPLINFTRSSKKWYFDSDGLLQEASNDTLPVSYDPDTGERLGWLIEEARTNLLLHSNDPTNAQWTKSGLSITQEGDWFKVEEDTSTGSHDFYQDVSNKSSGVDNTYSFEVKKGNHQWVRMFFRNFADWVDTPVLWVDLQNLVFGNVDTGIKNETIKSTGEDTARISFTATTASSTDFSVQVRFASSNGDGGSSRTGVGNHFFVRYLQDEIASFRSSPIITGGSTVTRSADVADITDLSWYNQDEGTFVVEGRTANGSGTQTLFDVSDATANERIYLQRNASNEMHLIIVDGGTTQADLNLGTVADDTDFKIAIAYKENNIAGVLDGGTVQTDSSATLPTVTQMNIGIDYNDSNHLNGYLLMDKHYQKRVTDAQLQTLTS